MKFSLLTFVLTTFGVVAAQSPDACIVTCSTQAAVSSGCVAFTNISCVCTSQEFQTAARACLTANCTAQDLTDATTLQSTFCKSAPPAPPPAASSPPASSGAQIVASSGGSTSVPSSTASPSSKTPGINTASSHGLQSGAIAGIAVGAVIAIIIATILLYFFRRRQKLTKPPMSQSTNFESGPSTGGITYYDENRSAAPISVTKQASEDVQTSKLEIDTASLVRPSAATTSSNSQLPSERNMPSMPLSLGMVHDNAELNKMLDDFRAYEQNNASRNSPSPSAPPPGARYDPVPLQGTSSSPPPPVPVPDSHAISMQNEIAILRAQVDRLLEQQSQQRPISPSSEAPPMYHPPSESY